MWLSLALVAALSTGCNRPTDAGLEGPQLEGKQLEGAVRAGLAERERRLTAYRVAGTVRDAEGEARYTFAVRAPGRMRGEVSGPDGARLFATDGAALYARAGGDGPVRTLPLAGRPPAEVAAQLHAVFGPFVCEGFRTPLLPPHAFRARRTTHPRAPEAVELSARVQAAPGEPPLEVTYVLRWPTLDFLHKRMEGGGGAAVEVRVEEEACEERWRLCVPRRWTQWRGGTRVAEVQLSEVALGDALPPEAFTLGAGGPGPASLAGEGGG